MSKGLLRSSEQYSYDTEVKFPVTIKEAYLIDEPLYLCKWNGGDIIEIHTKQSLYDTYQDTNLYDGSFQDDYDMSINEVLNELQVEHFRIFDNMDIRRIK